MKTYCLARAMPPHVIGMWAALLLALGVATAAQDQFQTEAGAQFLTRGPVHEAFAGTSMTGVTAGVVIKKTPYDPIVELPPDQRPEGHNVAWIPGYWSWDDDRNDFIWVSGVWRDLPPGRQWVPGYWATVRGGSQWISGFWGDAAQTEVTYLPPPPDPLEAGPSSPPPAPGNQWTSGCWVWQQSSYAWQPGYWVAQQPDWVWSPAHYTWTPRGYVFVPGYWDHDIVHRGVMFAPVYYDQPVYRRASYSYSPSIVIDLAAAVASLFVQTRSHQYYFGDYYDRRYEQRGFYPWYSRQDTRYGGDPIYAHYRARQLQRDPDWDTHVHEQYRYRREHVEARPPQTLALQISFINSPITGARDHIIGRSLRDAAQSSTLPQRLTPVNMDERTQIQTRGQEVHRLQSERARIETAPVTAGRSQRGRETAQPLRMRLPVSPVVARPVENVTGARIPPPMPVAPQAQVTVGQGRYKNPQKAEVHTLRSGSQKNPEKAERAGQPKQVKSDKQQGNREKAPSQKGGKAKKSHKK